MAKLDWGTTGERYYETGLDRGVLYVAGNAGVAWVGLMSVSESPSGGEATQYSVDGFDYLNSVAREEFEATIKAFGSPPEFAVCDGVASLYSGLSIMDQPRKPFNLSYRTRIGNDIDGVVHGYKIHLVYNALAAPSSRMNTTINNSPKPAEFSWSIATLAPELSGYKPTAHVVIDSTRASSDILSAIEDILYGNDEVPPRFLDQQELIDIFANYGIPVAVDAGSPSSVFTIVYDGGFPSSIHTSTLEGGTA